MKILLMSESPLHLSLHDYIRGDEPSPSVYSLRFQSCKHLHACLTLCTQLVQLKSCHLQDKMQQVSVSNTRWEEGGRQMKGSNDKIMWLPGLTLHAQ